MDVAEVADEEPKDEPLLEKKDRTGKTKEDQDGLHTSCGRPDGNLFIFFFINLLRFFPLSAKEGRKSVKYYTLLYYMHV